MTIRNLLEKHLLPNVPRQLGRFGYDIIRSIDLRNFRSHFSEKRVALLATHDLSRSGAPRIVLEMAITLRQHNYSIVLVTMADGPMRHEFEALGAMILVDCYPRAEKQYLINLARIADFAIANTVVTAKIALAWSRTVKTFWYLHEVSLLKARLLDKSVINTLKSVESVWAGSDICAKLVRNIRPDVSVFPYGIAPVDPPSALKADNLFRIGIFGSIESRKGQDYVVEAIHLLDDETRNNIKIDIYGRTLEAGYAQNLKAIAANYPMIEFHGEVDSQSYLESVRKCDAILVSSRDDTLPLVSLDALSSERMLLLTPSVGTSKWLTDGVDALIAETTSAEGVRSLIQRAFSEKDNDNIGKAGRITFDRNFSQSAFRERMISDLGVIG